MRSTKTYMPLLLIPAFVLAMPAAGQQKITTAKATIPFEFWVGDKKFPAGDYTLDSSIPTFVTVRNKNGSINEQVPTILYGEPVEKKDARLVFVNRNGKCHLKELHGVLGKRNVTSEYGKTSPQDNALEIALTYP